MGQPLAMRLSVWVRQVWIDAIHRRGGRQGGYGGPGPTTAIGADERRVLARNCLRPDCTFDDIGVDLDTAIGKEALESGTAGQGLADDLSQLGFA